jgi:hypothetical protein
MGSLSYFDIRTHETSCVAEAGVSY